jgi:hypothetical protein
MKKIGRIATQSILNLSTEVKPFLSRSKFDPLQIPKTEIHLFFLKLKIRSFSENFSSIEAKLIYKN